MLVNYKAFYFVLSPNPLRIYRGFKLSEEDLLQEDPEFKNISRYSYKPKKLTKEFGRCHRPENPIFYASFAQETIFSELDAGVGDFLLIGCWESKQIKQFRYYHLGVLDHYRKTRCLPLPINNADAYSRFLKDIENEVNKRLSDKENFGLLSMLIDAYLSEVFTKPAYSYTDYKLTSIVSEYLFENRKFDILGYPSVKHYGGVNYAIKPDVVNNDLVLKNISLYYIINNLGFGLYSKQLLSTINIDQGEKIIAFPFDEIKRQIKELKNNDVFVNVNITIKSCP